MVRRVFVGPLLVWNLSRFRKTNRWKSGRRLFPPVQVAPPCHRLGAFPLALGSYRKPRCKTVESPPLPIEGRPMAHVPIDCAYPPRCWTIGRGLTWGQRGAKVGHRYQRFLSFASLSGSRGSPLREPFLFLLADYTPTTRWVQGKLLTTCT